MTPEQDQGAEAILTFGPYTTERCIGQGGFGKVFVATHRATGRRVALKVDDGGATQRLQREYRALGAVAHPGIVRAIECGFESASQCAWLALDLLDGPDCERWWREHHQRTGLPPVDVLAALALVREVALAVQAFHAIGWLHRDVTPRNLVRHGGSVVLVDFGIARPTRAAAPEDDVTLDGVPIGAPRYMPPEQWAQPHDLTPAADLYQLAGVLHFLLEGEPPFDRRGSLQQRFPLAGRRQPFAPPVRELLANLTAHDAAARPQTAAAAIAAIDRCLASMPSVATGGRSEVTLHAEPRVASRRETTMTTEQLGARMAFADALRAKAGPLAEAGDRPQPLADGRLLIVLARGARFRLDRIAELAVPELRGAVVELARDGVALAAPCFQTLTTERDGKAIADVYRAFERCVVPRAMVANVQFSGPRGNARYACGVQPIDELTVGATTLVGVGGTQLTFSRLDAPDPFATLVVAPAAAEGRAEANDAGA